MVDIIAKKRREISMWSPATKGGRGEGGVATVLSKSFFFCFEACPRVPLGTRER